MSVCTRLASGPCCARLKGRTAIWAERTGAIMSQYYKQMQHGNNDAKRRLEERLAREEIGDNAYDKAVSYADDRSFKLFGVVFIALFGVAVLAISWFGY